MIDWTAAGKLIEQHSINLETIPAGRIPANWGDATDNDVWFASIYVPDRDQLGAAAPTALEAIAHVVAQLESVP